MRTIGRPRRLAVIALATAFVRPATAAELDHVELDTASGVVRERLPFDVPFVVVGQAPPGTTRVEATFQVRSGRDEAFGPEQPATPIVSGVDGEGHFRIQVLPLPPDRRVRFRLTFERRLFAGEPVRTAIEELLRRELRTGAPDVTPERAAVLRAALLAQYDLALAQAGSGLLAHGRGASAPGPAAFGRGDIVRRAASPVFDDQASEEAVQRELAALARDAFAARAERAEAVERYRDVTRSFEADLEAATQSPDLQALLAALEHRPETDPRDVGTRLALSRAARRLVGLEAGARAAVAAGRSVAEPQVSLESVLRPEEADAFAERYRATASGLQELREWLQGVVLTTGENRRSLDELLSRRRDRRGPRRRAPGAREPEGGAPAPGRATGRGPRRTRKRRRADPSRRRPGPRGNGRSARGPGSSAVVRQTLVTEPASTESGIYVGLDVGVLYPPELDRASLYLGANLYFRPINKRAPLRTHGGLGHRLSLTFGISLNNLKLEEGDPRFENLLGDDSNLLVGAGLRLSRSLRHQCRGPALPEERPEPARDRPLAGRHLLHGGVLRRGRGAGVPVPRPVRRS